MPRYRVHILDQRGNLKGAVDLDCADDSEAKEQVKVVLEDARSRRPLIKRWRHAAQLVAIPIDKILSTIESNR